jgi:hypothetical protein
MVKEIANILKPYNFFILFLNLRLIACFDRIVKIFVQQIVIMRRDEVLRVGVYHVLILKSTKKDEKSVEDHTNRKKYVKIY